MQTVLKPPKTLLEVFQSLPEGTLCQLIHNELIMSPSPKDIHQKILGKIYKQLDDFVEENDLGETRVAPYDVYFDNKNVFQPDIIFIAKENLHLIKENGLYGAPDMVIEILSPSTEKYDKGPKKDIYEQYGVKEYWMVEPADKSVTGYSLQKNSFVPIAANTGMVQSLLLNYAFGF